MAQMSADQIFQQDPQWLKDNYPQVYSQYVEKVGQPGAGLAQTQTSTQATQAQIPGITATSQQDQIKAQQAAALQNLTTDLKQNKMTLPDAMSKYKGLGMSADNILSQYISQSPWGFPKQNVAELQNMGVTPALLGDVKTPGSIANRSNVKGVMNELDSLNDAHNSVTGISALENALHLPLGGGNAAADYNTKKQDVMSHVLSAIPGSPQALESVKGQAAQLPDPMDPSGYAPNRVKGVIQTIKQTLLQQNNLKPEDVGLKSGDVALPKQQSGGDFLKGMLNTVLPAGGAMAGGALGGALGAAIPGLDLTGAPEVAGAVAGSGAGGAGGQALADILTGKKPGSDVATTGVLSAGGEGVGAALGGILGKAGGALAEKIPGNVFDKVVSASPNYSTDVQALKGTANKYGLLNGSSTDALQKMPKVMSDIGSQIQNGLTQVKTPVSVPAVTKNILSDFSKKTNAFENTEDFNNAQKYIKDRIAAATGGGKTTYSTLYNLKSAVADDLKPVFKAQANPNLSTNFTPKQEANLALWDGLKTEIDKADPNIRILNNDQHNMFDVAKGLVKHATSGKGGGGGVVGNIFDVLAGNMVGGLPGVLGVHAIRNGLATAGGRAAISNILQSGAVKQGMRAAGGGLGAILGAGATQ